MKMDEQIDKMKSQLTKILKECNSSNKEQAIKSLEEVGLGNDSAIKLLQAFGEMKSAEKTAQNVWNVALNSKSGVDFSTDIRKSSDAEARMTRIFNGVHSRCAFLMAINEIEPNEINDEILDKLYEQNIHENDITNSVLKMTYHYYSESKSKDEQLAQEKTRAARREEILEGQLQFSEQNYSSLNEKFKNLQGAYESLQTKFLARIASDEKHYKAALARIETLRNMLNKVQERGIIQTIGAKIAGIFGNKTQKLQEPTEQLPESLLCTSAEKIGMQEFDRDELSFLEIKDERNNNIKSPTQERKDAEWQQ